MWGTHGRTDVAPFIHLDEAYTAGIWRGIILVGTILQDISR